METTHKLGLGIMALASLAVAEPRATWGVAELLVAQKASLEHFRAKLGESLTQQITGFGIDLNAQKIAGTATIRYSENGVAKSVSFFCHTHGTEIDCH